MEATTDLSKFVQPCVDYIEERHKRGSDPGLCLCVRQAVTEGLIDFGWRATREVLNKQEAIVLAAKYTIVLRELGGTGGGIIGALAGAALRADGNHGRFVDLRGIRTITGVISASELKTRTAIKEVLDASSNPISDAERIESYDWIRPSLWHGMEVLRVQPIASTDGTTMWEPVENRKDKPKKIKEACK
jgi:hypothetical protein